MRSSVPLARRRVKDGKEAGSEGPYVGPNIKNRALNVTQYMLYHQSITDEHTTAFYTRPISSMLPQNQNICLKCWLLHCLSGVMFRWKWHPVIFYDPQ